VVWPKALTIPHSVLDCTDEMIKLQKTIAMYGFPIVARLGAVWILREITEWLRLPFAADQIQQRRVAHFCSLSKFQIASVLIRLRRTERWGLARSRQQWPNSKIAMLKFESEQF
jgi:hypothetical protein